MKAYRFALLFLTLFFAPPLSAVSGGFREGKVLEDGTDRAIPGAIVVVHWRNHTVARGTAGCVHVESAITDEQGRYRLTGPQPPSAIPSEDLEPIVTVYMSGYQQNRRRGRSVTQYLKPSVVEPKTRLDQLWHVNRMTECLAAGDGRKNLLPLKRAIYKEALDIAETDEEKQAVNQLKLVVDAIEKGQVWGAAGVGNRSGGRE